MPSKKTIAEKILSAGSGTDAYAGDIVVARIDRAFSHDANRPLPFQVLRDMGGQALFDPEHYYLFLDHSAPCPTEGIANVHQSMRRFDRETGAVLFDIGEGVCHQLMAEKGLALPGELIIGSDSRGTVSFGVEQMKHFINDRIDLIYDALLEDSVQGLINLLTFSPDAVSPQRKVDEKTASAYAAQGFRIYPTVLNTTLFYDERSDCFFKMLHPLGPMRRMLFSVTDRARQIYTLSRELNAWGIPLPQVRAYGKIRAKNVPVFAMERVRGRSLYVWLSVTKNRSP